VDETVCGFLRRWAAVRYAVGVDSRESAWQASQVAPSVPELEGLPALSRLAAVCRELSRDGRDVFWLDCRWVARRLALANHLRGYAMLRALVELGILEVVQPCGPRLANRYRYLRRATDTCQ
jgi:hypothetical protein